MNQVERQKAKRKRLFKRKLTPFLCEEMLYDYSQGYLDLETEADIEAFLIEHPTTQLELQKIESAIQYCGHIRALEVRTEMLEQIQAATSFWQPLYNVFHFKKWPEPVRFSVEGLLIAAAALLIMTYVPWGTIKQKWFQDSTIWIVSPPPETKPNTLNPAVLPTPQDLPQQATGKGPESPAVAAAGADAEKKSESEVSPPKQGAAGETAVASQKPAADAKKPEVAATPAVTSASVNQQGSSTAGSAPTRPQPVRSEPAGFVYRIYMDLSNLDQLSPRIADRIQGLGGEKAGEVPLGWRRDKGSYYHFTVPENQYDAVINTLKEYGEARVSKDPHRRVMPDGVIRMILWIEEVPGASAPSMDAAIEATDDLGAVPEEGGPTDLEEGPDSDVGDTRESAPDEDLVNDTDGL